MSGIEEVDATRDGRLLADLRRLPGSPPPMRTFDPLLTVVSVSSVEMKLRAGATAHLDKFPAYGHPPVTGLVVM